MLLSTHIQTLGVTLAFKIAKQIFGSPKLLYVVSVIKEGKVSIPKLVNEVSSTPSPEIFTTTDTICTKDTLTKVDLFEVVELCLLHCLRVSVG